jgi:hypothetical protein
VPDKTMTTQDSAENVRFWGFVVIGGGIFVMLLIILFKQFSGPKASWNYREIICDTAYQSEVSYAKRNPPYIDISLHEGCFSGYVTVPDAWQMFRIQMLGENPEDWVADWSTGVQRPWGPVSGNDLNAERMRPDNMTLGKRVRFQGHGTLRIYRLTGDENPTPEDIATEHHAPKASPIASTETPAPNEPSTALDAPPRVPPETVIVTPDTQNDPPPNRQLVHLESKEGHPEFFDLWIEECHRASDKIYCSGKIKNLADQVYHFNVQLLTAIDDRGNTLRGTTHGGDYDLIPNTPVNLTLEMDEPHQSEMHSVTLRLWAGPRSFSQGGPRDDMHYLTFPNVPLQ